MNDNVVEAVAKTIDDGVCGRLEGVDGPVDLASAVYLLVEAEVLAAARKRVEANQLNPETPQGLAYNGGLRVACEAIGLGQDTGEGESSE